MKRTLIFDRFSESLYPVSVPEEYKKVDEDLKELGEYYHSTLKVFERSLKNKSKRIRDDDNDDDNNNNKDDDDGDDKSTKKMKKIETRLLAFNVLAEKVKDFDRNEEKIKEEVDRLLQLSIDIQNIDRINSDLIW